MDNNVVTNVFAYKEDENAKGLHEVVYRLAKWYDENKRLKRWAGNDKAQQLLLDAEYSRFFEEMVKYPGVATWLKANVTFRGYISFTREKLIDFHQAFNIKVVPDLIDIMFPQTL